MATINNIKGTSYPSLQIGKNGVTIRQGKGLPSDTVKDSANNGDIYINQGNASADQGLWQYTNSAWFKIDVDATVPVGTASYYTGTTPPLFWLVRDGSSFDPKKYPLLSLLFPNGQLPNDQGLFLRGHDPAANYDRGGQSRPFGSFEEGSYLCRAGDFAAVVNFNGYQTFDTLYWDQPELAKISAYPSNLNPLSYGGGTFTASRDPNSSVYLWKYIGVSRPKNRNYLPIIYAGRPAY